MPDPVGLTVEEVKALSLPDAVALLQLTGSAITSEELQANIEAGAPLNSDGTIDLMKYAVWLITTRINDST